MSVQTSAPMADQIAVQVAPRLAAQMAAQLPTQLALQHTQPIFRDPMFGLALFLALRSSFSAVSTPNFARKLSFFSNFRDLQNLQTFAPL